MNEGKANCISHLGCDYLERKNGVFSSHYVCRLNLVKLIDVNVSNGHVLMYIQVVLMKCFDSSCRETSKRVRLFSSVPLSSFVSPSLASRLLKLGV